MGRSKTKAKARVEISRERDTLLDDYLGHPVVCFLREGPTLRGILTRVAKYEIELREGESTIIVFKHALCAVQVD